MNKSPTNTQKNTQKEKEQKTIKKEKGFNNPQKHSQKTKKNRTIVLI